MGYWAWVGVLPSMWPGCWSGPPALRVELRKESAGLQAGPGSRPAHFPSKAIEPPRGSEEGGLTGSSVSLYCEL